MGKSIGCWLKIFQNIIILTALGQLRYFQGHLCHEFLGHLTTRLRKDETFKRSFGLSLVFFERILTVLTVYQFTSTPSSPRCDWFISFCCSAVPWCTFGFYSLFSWILDTKIFLNNLLKLSIPFYFVTFRCVPFCSVSFQANCDFHSFCFIPLRFVPFRSVSFRSVPFRKILIRSVSFRSVPFRFIFNFDSFRSIPFRSVLFCSVPKWNNPYFDSFRSVPFHSVPFRFIIILN